MIDDELADDPELEVAADEVPSDAEIAGENVRRLSRAKQEAEDAKLFWTQALAHPIGRRELWKILDAGHAFEDRFGASPTGFPDPLASYKYAGEQSLAMRLFLSWQVLAPEGALLMLQEHHPQFPKPVKPKRKRGSA